MSYQVDNQSVNRTVLTVKVKLSFSSWTHSLPRSITHETLVSFAINIGYRFLNRFLSFWTNSSERHYLYLGMIAYSCSLKAANQYGIVSIPVKAISKAKYSLQRPSKSWGYRFEKSHWWKPSKISGNIHLYSLQLWPIYICIINRQSGSTITTSYRLHIALILRGFRSSISCQWWGVVVCYQALVISES